MTETLYQVIQARDNDYNALEKTYFSRTGGYLVGDPYNSQKYNISKIKLSASVVLPVYNMRDTVEQCLIAIEQSSFNRRYPQLLEVVVVDYGSTDGTWEILENLQINLNLKYVQEARYNKAIALNTAISVSEGDVIISCDADMILTPFSIEELLKRHQILENILLVGFRFDVNPDDQRIIPSKLREHLPHFVPKFYCDKRVAFNWPGWPENICAEYNHLKQLGRGKQIWMTSGNLLDAASWNHPRCTWNLPRLVYGALFSLRRSDFQLMEGFDERFHGWGWDDALVGARAIGLGNYIVPVYSAVGMHIAHADRFPQKWDGADINYQILQDTLKLPFTQSDGQMLAQARKRIVHQIERSSSTTLGDVPDHWFDIFDFELSNPSRLGKYLYYLGRYEEATIAFTNMENGEADKAWGLFNQGKALRAAGQHAEAVAVLKESIKYLPNEPLRLIEIGLAYAGKGDFDSSRSSFDQAYLYEPKNELLSYILNSSVEERLKRGCKFAAQGDHSLAVRDFEAVLIKDSNNLTALREREKSLHQLN